MSSGSSATRVKMDRKSDSCDTCVDRFECYTTQGRGCVLPYSTEALLNWKKLYPPMWRLVNPELRLRQNLNEKTLNKS